MDSEKFDKVVLDLLYDELDELTRASALRHIEQSSRAKSLFAELRATREVGALPLAPCPEGLEERILAAEREARAHRPLKERVGSIVSLLASYAMRPQLAMAALLLLMLGSSLIFLRARPGAHDKMQVTERGVPETESESVAIVAMPEPAALEQPPASPAADMLRSSRDRRKEDPGASESALSAPAPAARARRSETEGFSDKDTFEEKAKGTAPSTSPGSPYADAMLAYQEGRYAEAVQRFDEIAGSGGPNAASAALFAARANRRDAGCRAAAARFESVAEAHPGTSLSQEAKWLASECYRELGETERARVALRSLLDTDDYGERARSVLAAMATGTDSVATRAASRPAVTASQPGQAAGAAAKPAPPPPAER